MPLQRGLACALDLAAHYPAAAPTATVIAFKRLCLGPGATILERPKSPRGPEFEEQCNGFGSLPDAKGLRRLSYAKLNISLSQYWVDRSSTLRPGPRR